MTIHEPLSLTLGEPDVVPLDRWEDTVNY